MAMSVTLLAVAIGGAMGAVARLLVGYWLTAALGAWLPWGTLGVNVVGSLGIGIGYVLLAERELLEPWWRDAVLTGLLGAFTTFSAFSLQVVTLVQSGRPLSALGYAALSVVLCVMATASGLLLMRQW